MIIFINLEKDLNQSCLVVRLPTPVSLAKIILVMLK